MACTDFVWTDTGERWAGHCCTSCHEDDELGYDSLPYVTLRTEAEARLAISVGDLGYPWAGRHSFEGRVYDIPACCAVTNEYADGRLRYEPVIRSEGE